MVLPRCTSQKNQSLKSVPCAVSWDGLSPGRISKLLLLPRVRFLCLFLIHFHSFSYSTGLDASSQVLTNSDGPAIVQPEAEGLQVEVGAGGDEAHDKDSSIKMWCENEDEVVIVPTPITL